MKEVTVVGVDLAKRVFQLHGAVADGTVVFRKKLSRAQLLPFLAAQPACAVAMEACATAHHWGREIGRLGHAVRLIPPAYVKPFVKRPRSPGAPADAAEQRAAGAPGRVRRRRRAGHGPAQEVQEALESSPGLPPAVREIGRMYLEQIAVCSEKIATLERALRL